MLSQALHVRARDLWRATMPTLGPRGEALDAELRSVPGERGALLTLAYATLPISDAAVVPPSLIDSCGAHALFLRENSPFCRNIPEEMFLHFVWYPRVNSEALTDCRAFFHGKLAPRVAGLDAASAILAVNRWCAEHMTYQLTDGRTESPLTAYRCGTGRCGEESVFLTTALRSVGIPARQVYVPWWAHCDDNHAWVEAWDGERWRFLGACEPEPVLDRGWFCDAAARAPLVHYRCFFDCLAGDPLTEKKGSARLYSVIDRYADTFRLDIQVVDANGAPAANAALELDVMNMAAFRPLLRNRTDARGRYSVTLGRSDLRVEAFRDGLTAWAHVRPTAKTVRLCLRLAPPAEGSFDCDLTPPPPSARNRLALTPEQRQQNSALLSACAAARSERARRWSRPEYESAEAPWPRLFALAAGNAPEIWKFYAAHAGTERALAAQMLCAMAEKDCRDVRFELLESHFQSALNGARETPSVFPVDEVDRATFAAAVLNPRIGLEELEDWRPAIRSAFAPARLAEFAARPEGLMAHIRAAFPEPEGNYYPTLSMTPSAMLASGRADEKGRHALFVAIMRTLGIPARLDPVNGSAQYWRDGAWRSAEPAQSPSCRLALSARSDVRFVYEANWSLSRLEGNRWRTLDLQGAALPLELPLKQGVYRLTTSARLPNGLQLCRVTDLKLADGQCAAFALTQRAAPPEEMLARIPLDEIELRDGDGQSVRVRALSGEIGLIAWLRPGEEPTEHILNELLAASETLSAQMDERTALIFVLRDPAASQNAALRRVLAALPRARVLYEAPDDPTSGELARKLFLEPDVFPLAVLLDMGQSARFASAGYQVGVIDLTLNLIDILKHHPAL